MGSGRRFSGGRGGGGGRRLTEELRKLIKLHRNDYSTVDDIVQRIRHYQNYSRMGLKKLTRDVSLILEEEESLESSRSQPRKKQKKLVDEDEEKLQSIEKSYAKKLQLDGLESESESKSDSDSESRPSSSDVSTSVDEEEERKFDLMKSMLRETYRPKPAKVKETENEKEKNIELEVSTPKKKMINIINGGSKGEDNLRAARSGGEGGGGVVEAKDVGPRFKDLGGMEGVLKELELEVFVPLYHPHVPRRLGVNPISGILLHGPPGCGKTKLAHAIANETCVPFYKISATEVVSGVSGASEENIRELFTKAYRTAPSIIFIDEIDAIASKRENLQREMERRIVTQLMTCMDDFHKLAQPDSNLNSEAESVDKRSGYVLVIGATNRPDALDPALRRPGRFDREIRLGVPDENARVEILSVLTKKCTLEGSLDLLQIARATPGFVGADLYALVDKAGNLAMRRILDQRKSEISREYTGKEHSEEWWKIPWSAEEIEKLSITMADFEKAAKLVQPSSRREGFSTIPNVKWEDVGGLHGVRNEFELCIVRRVKSPEIYQKFGVNLETGILLYGPPGCGKTLIAKAVANEAGANFIHIKGPELLNKYVGESEMAVRTLFGRARTCSPCILFFDEVDALTTKRGNEGGWVVERLLNQLLIELDGADQRQGVFVIGATNRPNVMDPAVLRPGRFGKLLYVPLPSSDDRGLILKAHAKGRPIDPSVDLFSVGRTCENFSGADLKNLMDEASMVALVEAAENGAQEETFFTINENHFQRALSKIAPSVSEEQIQDYKIWAEHLKAT